MLSGLVYFLRLDILGSMLRQIAPLLLVAQVATFTGPLVTAQPAAGHVSSCSEVVAYRLATVSVQPEECDNCAVSDCSHMIGCAVLTFAVPNELEVTFYPLLEGGPDMGLVSGLGGSPTAPALPPPKA